MTRLHMLFAPGITHPRYRTTAWYETHAALREQVRRDEIRRAKSKHQRHVEESNSIRQTGAAS